MIFDLYLEGLGETKICRKICRQHRKDGHGKIPYYKNVQAKKISIATSGKASVDKLIQTVLDAITEFQNDETRKKIRAASEQSQKEVDDLHTRIAAGIKATKANNAALPEAERKQIGRVIGQKVETKKAKEAKDKIRKMSKDFDGNMTDKKFWKSSISPATPIINTSVKCNWNRLNSVSIAGG